jgi:subtilisin family serine protease
VYPASFDFENIIVVSSSNRRDEFPWMSANYGQTSVDLVAPGEAIYSCWSSAEDAYAFNSGTSMAAPMVAGSLALLKAEFPEETALQLKQRVMRSVDRSREFAEVCVSGGRLNLGRAIREWIELSVEREGEELVIEFAGRTGKKYVVEATSDFSSWATVENMTATSNGMLRVEQAMDGEARFFRVRLD